MRRNTRRSGSLLPPCSSPIKKNTNEDVLPFTFPFGFSSLVTLLHEESYSPTYPLSGDGHLASEDLQNPPLSGDGHLASGNLQNPPLSGEKHWLSGENHSFNRIVNDPVSLCQLARFLALGGSYPLKKWTPSCAEIGEHSRVLVDSPTIRSRRSASSSCLDRVSKSSSTLPPIPSTPTPSTVRRSLRLLQKNPQEISKIENKPGVHANFFNASGANVNSVKVNSVIVNSVNANSANANSANANSANANSANANSANANAVHAKSVNANSVNANSAHAKSVNADTESNSRRNRKKEESRSGTPTGLASGRRTPTLSGRGRRQTPTLSARGRNKGGIASEGEEGGNSTPSTQAIRSGVSRANRERSQSNHKETKRSTQLCCAIRPLGVPRPQSLHGSVLHGRACEETLSIAIQGREVVWSSAGETRHVFETHGAPYQAVFCCFPGWRIYLESEVVACTTAIRCNVEGVQCNVESIKSQSGGASCNSDGVKSQSGGARCNSDGVKSQSGGVKSQSGGVKSQSRGVKSLSGGVKSLSGGVKSLSGGVKGQSGGVKSQTGSARCYSDGVKSQSVGARCNSDGVSCNLEGIKSQSGGTSCNLEGIKSQSGGTSCNLEGASCNLEASSCNLEGAKCVAVLQRLEEDGHHALVEIFALSGPIYKKSVALPFHPQRMFVLSNGLLFSCRTPDGSTCAFTLTDHPDARLRPITFCCKASPLHMNAPDQCFMLLHKERYLECVKTHEGNSWVEWQDLPQRGRASGMHTNYRLCEPIMDSPFDRDSNSLFDRDSRSPFDRDSNSLFDRDSDNHIADNNYEDACFVNNRRLEEARVLWVCPYFPLILVQFLNPDRIALFLQHRVSKPILERRDHALEVSVQTYEFVAQSSLSKQLSFNLYHSASEWIFQEIWCVANDEASKKKLGICPFCGEAYKEACRYPWDYQEPFVICLPVGPVSLSERLRLVIYDDVSKKLRLIPLFSGIPDRMTQQESINDVLVAVGIGSSSFLPDYQATPLNLATALSGRVDFSSTVCVAFDSKGNLPHTFSNTLELDLSQVPQYILVLHLDGILSLYIGVELLCKIALTGLPEGFVAAGLSNAMSNSFSLLSAKVEFRDSPSDMISSLQQTIPRERHLYVRNHRCKIKVISTSWLLRSAMQSLCVMLPSSISINLLRYVFNECLNPSIDSNFGEASLGAIEWSLFERILLTMCEEYRPLVFNITSYPLVSTRNVAVNTFSKKDARHKENDLINGFILRNTRNGRQITAETGSPIPEGKRRRSEKIQTSSTLFKGCYPRHSLGSHNFTLSNHGKEYVSKSPDNSFLNLESPKSPSLSEYDEDPLFMALSSAKPSSNIADDFIAFSHLQSPSKPGNSSLFTDVPLKSKFEFTCGAAAIFLCLHCLYEDLKLRLVCEQESLRTLGELLFNMALVLNLPLFVDYYCVDIPGFHSRNDMNEIHESTRINSPQSDISDILKVIRGNELFKKDLMLLYYLMNWKSVPSIFKIIEGLMKLDCSMNTSLDDIFFERNNSHPRGMKLALKRNDQRNSEFANTERQFLSVVDANYKAVLESSMNPASRKVHSCLLSSVPRKEYFDFRRESYTDRTLLNSSLNQDYPNKVRFNKKNCNVPDNSMIKGKENEFSNSNCSSTTYNIRKENNSIASIYNPFDKHKINLTYNNIQNSVSGRKDHALTNISNNFPKYCTTESMLKFQALICEFFDENNLITTTIFPIKFFPLSNCIIEFLENLYNNQYNASLDIIKDKYISSKTPIQCKLLPLVSCSISVNSYPVNNDIELPTSTPSQCSRLSIALGPQDVYCQFPLQLSLLKCLVKRGMNRTLLEQLDFAIQIPIREILRAISSNDDLIDLPVSGIDLLSREDIKFNVMLFNLHSSQKLDDGALLSNIHPSITSNIRCRYPILDSTLPAATVERETVDTPDCKLTRWGGLAPSKLWLNFMFPDDDRCHKVARILDSSKMCSLKVVVESANSGAFDEAAHREHQLAIFEHMSLPVGRSAFTLGSISAVFLVSTILDVPPIELRAQVSPIIPIYNEFRDSSEPERYNTLDPKTISRDLKRIPLIYDTWPEFHNGVASGLMLDCPRENPQLCGPEGRCADSKMLQWVRRHYKTYKPNEFGGILLGMGLQGHLKTFREENWLQVLYDHMEEETVQTGLILGVSCSNIGSKSQNIKRLCLSHLPNALPGSYMEIEMKSTAQCAALVGLGLIFAGTADRIIAKTLFKQLIRPPCQLSDKQLVDRESYALCAGWGLGCLFLGVERPTNNCNSDIEKNLIFLANLSTACCRELISCTSSVNHKNTSIKNTDPLLAPFCSNTRNESYSPMTCTTNFSESGSLSRSSIYMGSWNAAEVSIPASIAIGLIYLQTNDEQFARKLKLPRTIGECGEVLPQVLTSRILARNLIMWKSITPSHLWIASQVPPFLRKFSLDVSHNDSNLNTQVPLPYLKALDSNNESFIDTQMTSSNNDTFYSWESKLKTGNIALAFKLRAHSIGGALWSLGLRYAGTHDPDVANLIIEYLLYYKNIPQTNLLADQSNYEWLPSVQFPFSCIKKPINFDSFSAQQLVIICCIALGCVMAGSGNINVFRLILAEKAKLKDLNRRMGFFGDHLILNQVLGILFLEGGQFSFCTNQMAIASLILSLYPFNAPRDPYEQRYHLQACRHLHVLASQKRALIATEVATGLSVRLPIQLEVLENTGSSSKTKIIKTILPCLMPESDTIVTLQLNSPRYWPIKLHRQINYELTVAKNVSYIKSEGRKILLARDVIFPNSVLDNVLNIGVIVVKRRISCLPHCREKSSVIQQENGLQNFRSSLLRSLPNSRIPTKSEIDEFLITLMALGQGFDSKEDFLSAFVILQNLSSSVDVNCFDGGNNRDEVILQSLIQNLVLEFNSLFPNVKDFDESENSMQSNKHDNAPANYDISNSASKDANFCNLLFTSRLNHSSIDRNGLLRILENVEMPSQLSFINNDIESNKLKYTNISSISIGQIDPILLYSNMKNQFKSIDNIFSHFSSTHYNNFVKELRLVQDCIIADKLESLPVFDYLKKLSLNYIHSVQFPISFSPSPLRLASFRAIKSFYYNLPIFLLRDVSKEADAKNHFHEPLIPISTIIDIDRQIQSSFQSIPIDTWIQKYYTFGHANAYLGDCKIPVGLGESYLIYHELPLFSESQSNCNHKQINISIKQDTPWQKKEAENDPANHEASVLAYEIAPEASYDGRRLLATIIEHNFPSLTV